MRISSIRFFPALSAIFMLEEGSSRVAVYRSLSQDHTNVNSGFPLLGYVDASAHVSGGQVFSVEHIPQHNILVLVVGNFTLQFWDCRPLGGSEQRGEGDALTEAEVASLQKEPKSVMSASDPRAPALPLFIRELRTQDQVQRHAAWLGHCNYLVTGGLQDYLMLWSFQALRQGFVAWHLRLTLQGEVAGHVGGLGALLPLPDIGLLVSGGLDGVLKLGGELGARDGWGGQRGITSAVPLHSGKRVGCGKLVFITAAGEGEGGVVHPRGVCTLTYAAGTRQVVSTGYESYLQVWDVSDTLGSLVPTLRLGEGMPPPLGGGRP
jgi:WD40 repeat protein